MLTIRAIIALAIACLVASCVSPESLLTQIATKAGQSALGEGRRQTIISEPNSMLQALASSRENGGLTEAQTARMERQLTRIVNDLRSEIEELSRAGTTEAPYHARLPRIQVTIERAPDRTCVSARQGEEPTINICEGFLLLFVKPEEPSLADAEMPGGLEGLLFRQMAQMLNRMDETQKALSFQEVLHFMLAHETTHIWLDPPGGVPTESEIRADAYGVLLAAQVSRAQERQAELMARFSRTGSLTVHDPVDVSIMGTQFGAQSVFVAYQEYCFESGCNPASANHLSIEARLEQVSSEMNDIVERRIADKSAFDIGLEHVRTSLIESILGYAPADDD